METLKLTNEQELILKACRDSGENLLIQALAGAAKTSTLVLAAEVIPTEILCLAFNKKIAEEMTTRLPPNAKAMTLNSLGHRAWASSIGKRLILNKSKTYSIVSGLVEAVKDSRKRTEFFESFTDILRTVEHGKRSGWIPDGGQQPGLIDDAEFFGSLDEVLPDHFVDLIREATLASIKQAMRGEIDFDDQIFMPTLFHASFPRYPVVMVDEAQDLSPLNHAMLVKLAKGSRVIAVGDSCQAIYGFRGADENSMEAMQSTFAMKELFLSTSFRCPINVVQEARWRAPRMQWPAWAIQGSVRTLGGWGLDDLPEQATIICRNNAPIFSMAIRLFANGRYAQILGNDIGKFLIKTLKKLGPLDMPRDSILEAIDSYGQFKMAKSRKPEKVKDELTCLRIFADEGENLGQVIAYAESVMNNMGPIKLMTGHKSKGLEFDHVFILDRDLVRVGEGQESNLLYVMQTRAKQTLTYIKSENFNGKVVEE